MPRRCFFSFHFKPDASRASQVRNIGVIDGNRPAHDNDWSTIASAGDRSIRRWIDDQLEGRSCTIVLVGASTANRFWINHEIVESWNRGLGVVGIRIHGLKDLNGQMAVPGPNPFDFISHNPTRSRLSSIVKCYDPAGLDSQARYDWIAKHLSNAVEEAVAVRKNSR